MNSPLELNQVPEAPRVRLEDIEDSILDEQYFTAADGVYGSTYHTTQAVPTSDKVIEALSLLTFCVLVLKNGFTVTGESACVSPANFDARLGREIARKKAIEKIWPLMGFALKDQLHRATNPEAHI